MEICVSNEDIKTMFSYVYNDEEEICANLETIPGTQISSFIKRSIIKGSKELLDNEKTRAYCKYKFYNSVIFHSHPKTSRSYPSYEDIEKLKKHDEIEVSIVATRWGIYVIKRDIKDPLTPSGLGAKGDGSFKDTFMNNNKVEKYLKFIYKLENSTGFTRVELGEFTPNIEKSLNTYIKKLGYYTGLKFSFYNWSYFNL